MPMPGSVYALWLTVLVLITGCGPATMKMAAEHASPLDAAALFELVAGNSLILSAYDFSGTLYFGPDGELAGIDSENQEDVGGWDITDENRLCLKFRLWYYGDVRCYAVFPSDNQERYTFFTSNGAAYYTAMMIAGDPAGLAGRVEPEEQPRSVRNDLAARADETAPAATEAERRPVGRIEITPSGRADSGQTVKRLAGNCPGCNMAGIDLKEASLIKANLENANLAGADLRYANLRRANLRGAILTGARLAHANLPGADLTGANLADADLTGANLLLANLTGADVSGAVFADANLEKIIGLETRP